MKVVLENGIAYEIRLEVSIEKDNHKLIRYISLEDAMSNFDENIDKAVDEITIELEKKYGISVHD